MSFIIFALNFKTFEIDNVTSNAEHPSDGLSAFPFQVPSALLFCIKFPFLSDYAYENAHLQLAESKFSFPK